MYIWKYVKILFLMTLISIVFLYGTLYLFSYKVQEDYNKLVHNNRYTLDSYNTDLYILCMLDYHINPNGKDMLQECNKLAKIPHKKLDTPYYDFYVKYVKDFIK